MWKYKKEIIIVLVVVVAIIVIYSYMSNPVIKNVVDQLEKSATKSYGKRSISSINKIVLHHSATTSGSAESYARYHVETRGWPGIGYHYVIEKDGTIKQTNNIDTLSYHTKGQNTSGIGICLTGNFDTQTLSGKQKSSLLYLIKKLRSQHGNIPLYGHRDFATKSCPGDNINVAEIDNESKGGLA